MEREFEYKIKLRALELANTLYSKYSHAGSDVTRDTARVKEIARSLLDFVYHDDDEIEDN
jgi:hypothetical protein